MSFLTTKKITRIDESFSCSTFFMYIFILLLALPPILLCIYILTERDDDRNDNKCCFICYSCSICYTDCKCCIDVDHYCSNCGKKIGSRNSFTELCPCC